MAKQQYIGRYKILHVLGQGNMGFVFKAFDPILRRLVAIKTIRTRWNQSGAEAESFKDRFLREAQANSKLQHPNIVAIYDSGIHEGEPFLVMEYLEGNTLDQIMVSDVRLVPEVQLHLLGQIAAGLDLAHKKGIVHRDIKPANILVTNDLTLKIVDFGLARFLESNLTTTDAFLGTPSYASPEQIISGSVDARSDIFSFGILAYELLVGRRPFPGESIGTIVYHTAHSPPNLEFGHFECPVELSALREIFECVLAKDPDQRFQTCETFFAKLGEAIVAPPLREDTKEGLKLVFTSMHQVHIERITSREAIDPSQLVETTDLNPKNSPLRAFRGPTNRKWHLLGAAFTALVLLFLAAAWLKPKAHDPMNAGSGTPNPLGRLDEDSRLAHSLDSNSQTEEGENAIGKSPDGIALDLLSENGASEEGDGAGVRKVETLRRQFFDILLKEKNTVDAAILLAEIKSLGAETVELQRALDAVKNESREKTQANRKGTIELQFRAARDSADIVAMRELLAQYRKNWPEDLTVISLWGQELSDQEGKVHVREVAVRAAFTQAIKKWDAKGAATALAELDAMGSATAEDHQQESQLRQRVYFNSLGIKFVRIPAGAFQPEGEWAKALKAEEVNQVFMPADFYMSACEVTQGQWETVMGKNPSRTAGWNLPVENVSWRDVLNFVAELNRREGGAFYRLPNEAEWEYACRAGTRTQFNTGERLSVLQANFAETGNGHIVDVGSFPPNDWGLHDMHGNVSEWCSEVELSATGARGAKKSGITLKGKQILRGGNYQSPAESCASGYRARLLFFQKAFQDVGFRIIRTIPEPE